MNLTQLIDRTRDVIADRASENTTIKEWSDEEVVRALNGASDTLWKKAVLADENWGLDYVVLGDLTYTQVEVTGNFIEILLQDNLPGFIKRVEEDISTASDYSGTEIPHISLNQSGFYKKDEVWKSDTQRGWFWGPTQKLMFTKTSSSFTPSEIRLWYVRKPPHFARFTLTTSAQHPSTSTLFFEPRSTSIVTLGDMSTLNHYYKNSWVHCTASTETGSQPAGNRFLVTAWSTASYPNFTMSLSPAHNVAGAETTTWEVGFMWPEEHTDLIAFLAAKRLLVKGAAAEQVALVTSEAAPLMQEFILNIENRQIQTPREVVWSEGI